MRRREFISMLGGTLALPAAICAAWPTASPAQQQQTTTIGFLHGSSAEGQAFILPAFQRGLNEHGYAESKNLNIEYRWADGHYDRLPAMAKELADLPVAVIFAVTPVAALAAKSATRSIPIVFVLGSDPVKDGLVTSLSRPEHNITGVTFFSNLLVQKRMELLHELAPQATSVALLLNPGNANAELEMTQTTAAARGLGLEIVVLHATNEGEIEAAFEKAAQQHLAALVVSGDVLFNSQRKQIADSALRAGIATCFANRAQAAAGGLISYGASILDAVRQGGDYVGRILKGARPGDLPVQEPSNFDFVINLKTAKALHLSVPPSMQALATELID